MFLPCHTAKMGQLFIQGELSENTLHIRVGKEIEISLTAGSKVDIQVYGHPYTLERGTELKINMPMCQ